MESMMSLRSFLAALFLLAGMCHDAGAQQQARPIPSLGLFTVGSPLSRVQTYRERANCSVKNGSADCTFVDSKNGIRYTVLKKNVVMVVASEGAKARLPFGLKFGENLFSAAQKLTSEDNWNFNAVEGRGAVLLSSAGIYLGEGKWTFNVELLFVKDRLTEVRYNSGTV